MAFQNESTLIAACRCNSGFSNVGSIIDCSLALTLGRRLIHPSPSRLSAQLCIALRSRLIGSAFSNANLSGAKIQLKILSKAGESLDIWKSSVLRLRFKPLTVQQPTLERNIEMQQTLTRWEPLREMEEFQNRLSTLFGRQ